MAISEDTGVISKFWPICIDCGSFNGSIIGMPPKESTGDLITYSVVIASARGFLMGSDLTVARGIESERVL